MTPFNSTVVRFRAKTRDVRDQGDRLGDETRPRDGALAAWATGTAASSLISATATGRTQTGAPRRSISPRSTTLNAFARRAAAIRASARRPRPACAQSKPESCMAVHFPIPDGWTMPGFKDSAWPHAIVWRPIEVSFTALRQLRETLRRRRVHLDPQHPTRQSGAGLHTARGPRR